MLGATTVARINGAIRSFLLAWFGEVVVKFFFSAIDRGRFALSLRGGGLVIWADRPEPRGPTDGCSDVRPLTSLLPPTISTSKNNTESSEFGQTDSAVSS
jgi:hypothetical protein